MASPGMGTGTRIVIHDVPSKSQAPFSESCRTWHPLDHIHGHVAIHNLEDVSVEKISIHFQGHSRVWIDSLNTDGDVVKEVSSYKFLHQSHDAIGIKCQKNVATNTSDCIADFSLLIPKWAILKADHVPDQCLNLPPSMFLGQSYRAPGKQLEYGQPNIEYELVARVTLRHSTYPSDSPAPSIIFSAFKSIKIMPFSLPSPPTNISDFPAEFISSNSHLYTKFFSGTRYTITISADEPPAVVLEPPEDSTVVSTLKVDIEANSTKAHPSKRIELPNKSKNMAFKVQQILRAKTFYSTLPFHKMPGQSMLTSKGTLRLKDEILQLASYNVSPSSWETPMGNPSSGGETSASWSTAITVPLTLPPSLIPAFCCATAARQYSLIMRIKAVGCKTEDFILEVPVQVVHARKSKATDLRLALTEHSPIFEPTSSLMEPGRMALQDEINESIPGYS